MSTRDIPSLHPPVWQISGDLKLPDGSEGLPFLPYLSGERTLYFDLSARGVFIGLILHHNRAHITSAVLDAELVAINTTKAGAYGVALLAGVGAGVWSRQLISIHM